MQFLVILKVKSEATEKQQARLRMAEAEEVWKLLKVDVLRSIHFIPGPGVVLFIEAADEVDADHHVKRLPMVHSGIVSAEVLPLRPFTGLEALFARAQ